LWDHEESNISGLFVGGDRGCAKSSQILPHRKGQVITAVLAEAHEYCGSQGSVGA